MMANRHVSCRATFDNQFGIKVSQMTWTRTQVVDPKMVKYSMLRAGQFFDPKESMGTLHARTRALLCSPLFQLPDTKPVSTDESRSRSWKRTVAIGRALGEYSLTEHDIRTLSSDFWRIHLDPIMLLDSATSTLLTIQLNLVVGTLGMYATRQPGCYLSDLIRKVLQFEVTAQFCLTEQDHGLDARSLETTATLLPDGQFDLHTPNLGASKYMPPTFPCGLPCVAVVFARLMVFGEDYGIRSFVVNLTDGRATFPGITVKLLQGRNGCKPVDHCITSFHHLRLPKTALLGEVKPCGRLRQEFQQSIWRVAVGTLSLTGLVITSLCFTCFIAAKYSQRRLVTSSDGRRISIIAFKTQYQPILISLAQYYVLQAFYHQTTKLFTDNSNSLEIRHAFATIIKAITMRHGTWSHFTLSERLGAQGLFNFNQVSELLCEMRGIMTAEGDVLVLCIRLATELILGRYTLPKSKHMDSALAKHEQGLFEEARKILATMTHHRTDSFNRAILPRCESLVQSIGHRMAYDAAVDAGVDERITALYLASTIQLDAAWYSENLGLVVKDQFTAEDIALNEALPCLDEWVNGLNIGDYVSAPIVDAERWKRFVDGLQVAPCSEERPPVERNCQFLKAHL